MLDETKHNVIKSNFDSPVEEKARISDITTDS
jgi:hypothetical protein